jgi:antitoxin ParD1/3/4
VKIWNEAGDVWRGHTSRAVFATIAGSLEGISMSRVEKISIALTPLLAQSVREAVESDDYPTTSEVVRAAVREWSDQRAGLSDRALAEAWREGLSTGAPRAREAREDFLIRNLPRLEADLVRKD